MATNSASKLPAGTPTDSEHAECGGVETEDRLRSSVSRSTAGGYEDFEFFGLNFSTVSPIGLNFGPLMGGTPAHSPDIF